MKFSSHFGWGDGFFQIKISSLFFNQLQWNGVHTLAILLVYQNVWCKFKDYCYWKWWLLATISRYVPKQTLAQSSVILSFLMAEGFLQTDPVLIGPPFQNMAPSLSTYERKCSWNIFLYYFFRRSMCSRSWN